MVIHQLYRPPRQPWVQYVEQPSGFVTDSSIHTFLGPESGEGQRRRRRRRQQGQQRLPHWRQQQRRRRQQRWRGQRQGSDGASIQADISSLYSNLGARPGRSSPCFVHKSRLGVSFFFFSLLLLLRLADKHAAVGCGTSGRMPSVFGRLGPNAGLAIVNVNDAASAVRHEENASRLGCAHLSAAAADDDR